MLRVSPPGNRKTSHEIARLPFSECLPRVRPSGSHARSHSVFAVLTRWLSPLAALYRGSRAAHWERQHSGILHPVPGSKVHAGTAQASLPLGTQRAGRGTSGRGKPGLNPDGQVLRTGRGTKPSGQSGLANKDPSKLKPHEVEGACQTVSVIGTGHVPPTTYCYMVFNTLNRLADSRYDVHPRPTGKETRSAERAHVCSEQLSGSGPR